MKKSIWIIIGIVIVVLIIIVGIYSYNIYSKCSIGYNKNCKRECSVDSDCTFYCGCGAINVKENCGDFGSLTIDCLGRSVKCENNKCVIDYTSSGCKTVGETGGSCCGGLILSNIFYNENLSVCEHLYIPICIRCGDGKCGLEEDKCNCPQDCPV